MGSVFAKNRLLQVQQAVLKIECGNYGISDSLYPVLGLKKLIFF